MQVKKLSLANVRGFQQAEFEFKPGMNLIVGVNGAGKSTVLDVLRIMFSEHLPRMVKAGNHRLPFKETDIRKNDPFMSIDLTFDIGDKAFNHTYWQDSKALYEEKIKSIRSVIVPHTKSLPSSEYRNALIVYFSPRRSLVLNTKPSRASSKGGTTAAYADALKSRELKLPEFVEWWKVQEKLGQEDERNKSRFDQITEVALDYLDKYKSIALDPDKQSIILEKKDTSQQIDVSQLSDGERSIFTLIMDLSRRLLLAHDSTDDPLSNSQALVLIDELDLHLHPSWQRTICERLERTFPNCQFIATTHSPQIIGEVPADKIILIDNGQITRPDQSLGMDSNWILKHLMGVDERDSDTAVKLQVIEKLIDAEAFDDAITKIDELRSALGEFPRLVSLQTKVDVLSFFDDESDSE